MTPENELHIRVNSRRKSVYAKMVVLVAAKRITFPDMRAWVDELAALDISNFPRPEREDDHVDPLFERNKS